MSKYTKKFFKEYKERNKKLINIGFNNYKEYMRSDLWKKIRNKHIKNHNRCEYCGEETKLNVHHLDYEKIGTDEIDYLITLCDRCHLLSHSIHSAFPYLTIRQSSNKSKIIIKHLLRNKVLSGSRPPSA